MSPALQRLAQLVTADGLVCSLKHDGGCLQIFQEDDRGFSYYEVIPWRADPRVPVLYVTRYDEDSGGTVRAANTEFAKRSLSAGMARWVTATEHPFSALPTLYIHPCQTQEWLNATGGDWHLWLQHFGRPVGLRV